MVASSGRGLWLVTLVTHRWSRSRWQRLVSRLYCHRQARNKAPESDQTPTAHVAVVTTSSHTE
jgi:hypothetical protein